MLTVYSLYFYAKLDVNCCIVYPCSPFFSAAYR